MSLEDVCRACLRPDHTLSSLLDAIVPKLDSPSDSVMDMWEIFTKYLKTTEGSFPDQICTDCLAEIHRTYSFMLKCERSEDIMKKMKNDEISSKKRRNKFALHEHDNYKKIKSENNKYQHISQIKTDDFERNSYDEVDVDDREQYEVMANADVDNEVDPQSQYTIIVHHENDNFAIELFDQQSCENEVTKDEMPEIGHIKYEPELKICTENDEFDASESVVQSNDSNNYQQKFNLFLHSRPHSEELPYKCESCSRSFRHKQHLQSHLRCHTAERPFKCEICSSNFRRKSHLNLHSKLHKEERSLKCEICSSTFQQRISLNIHLKLHSDERSYKCEICPKVFQLKHDFLDHKGSHMEGRPLKCKICRRSFKHEASFANHLRYQHDQTEESFTDDSCSQTYLHQEISNG